MLKLSRPIVFFDLETTGVNMGRDRIVEIAMIKVKPDGTRERKRKLINPEMPIPEESTALHGITNDMVKDAPTFKQVANEIKVFFDQCDIGGYNSNKFDIPMLAEEFLRVGLDVDFHKRKMIDVQHIFYKMEPRTLTAAYKFFCEKELQYAHSAEADVDATIEVFEAQLNKYPGLGDTVESVLGLIGEEKIIDYARRFVYDMNGVPVFNFGKHKGKPILQVLKAEPSYYSWMLNGDFALDTKKKLTELYNAQLNTK